MSGLSVDPVMVAVRRLAIEIAADRLGVRREPILAYCSRCDCPLHGSDEGTDALPCEDGCTADLELAEALL